MSETKSFKGTTKTGFPFDISMERMENYEVVETIAEIDENPLVLPRLLKLLLGDQVAALKAVSYTHLPIIGPCYS